MIARVQSFLLQGIEAVPCEVEVDYAWAHSAKTRVVGLPDAAVRESQERVRAAILNSRFRFPHGAVTINLAPAHLRKEGPVYDLPIAVALLAAGSTIAPPEQGGPGVPLDRYMLAGELALDGRVRPVRGIASLALLARTRGLRGLVVPSDNAAEASVVGGIEVRPVATLADVVGLFNGGDVIAPHPPTDVETLLAAGRAEIDFADVRGQEAAKRALTVAAAGGHNVLMIGPAGTGKTMMARALVGVLPPMSRDEALEVTRIHSSAGCMAPGAALVTRRPVRAPHHTASAAAIIGGGPVPRPGDVSLAHRGVLFLDELPEFARTVLETLRQPLEGGSVTIARARGSVTFPARFMLVAAMNPTARGNRNPGEAGRREMDEYLARLSGPLVDRIDIHVEVPAVPWKQLAGSRAGTDSATIAGRVGAARGRQRARQGALTNAELPPRELNRHAALAEQPRMLLGQALTELGLSARAYDKVRRVARTIADLEAAEAIETHHVAEAIQYRLLDRAL